MINKFQFFKPATINNLQAHTRRMISLTLAFLVLCAGQFESVLAARSTGPLQSTVYKFVLTAQRKGNSKKPICIDDKVSFLVGARRIGYEKGQSKPKNNHTVTGIKVTATGDDKLRLYSPSPADITYDSWNGGFKVEFTFKAQKAGTAEVFFDAMAPVEYVSDEMLARLSPEALNRALYMKTSAKVEVIDCPIKVSAVDRYELNAGGGYLIDLVAVLDETTLKPVDAEGKVHEGEATKQVVTRQFAPSCKIIIGVGTRPVKIRAEKLETGLKVTMTDGEMTIEDHTSCPGGEVGLPIIFPEVGPHSFELPPGVNHYQHQTGGAGFRINLEVIVTRKSPK